MNEIVDMTMKAGPELFGVIGYGTGLILEKRAIRNSAKQRSAAYKVLEKSKAFLEPRTTTRRERMGERARKATAVLPLAGALGGIACGLLAFNAVHQKSNVASANLEIVVDHSGATNFNAAGLPASKQINSIAAKFNKTGDVVTNAIIASSGYVKSSKVENVSLDTPFGDAPLDQAANLALSNTAKEKNYFNITHKNSNAAVLVLTNGNDFGNKDAIIKASQEQGKTPVFIVNVEGDDVSSNQNTADFRAIAKQTNGEYWNAHQDNIGYVSNAVRNAIVPHEVGNKNPNNNIEELYLMELALGLGALCVSAYSNRSQMPLGVNN
ncbi:MAG: hypothetical protein NVSMB46_04270 [Candidatus Saccharimonadales bacterium]